MDMTTAQEIPSESYPEYINEANNEHDTGDYLTPAQTTKFIQHPSPPDVKDGTSLSTDNLQQNITDDLKSDRYVDSRQAPGNGTSINNRYSEEKKDSEYLELDDCMDVNINRPLPNPEEELKPRKAPDATRQGSRETNQRANKRIVRILVVVIVFLILIIAAGGGYVGWKLTQMEQAATPCPQSHPQSVCVCETDRCSSACSQDTCTSCCSTAAGAPVLSVSVDGRTAKAPVTVDNWIVIMKRESGYVDFISPNWQSYKDGFGNLKGEFWLGNEIMHKLTTNGSQWRLRVDMKAYSGECRYAEYNNFWIGPETDFYQMHISNYSGNAGDSLTATEEPWYNHDGVYFSTYDADHDLANDTNCALQWLGGWWYNECFYAKFTGIYGQNTGQYTGVAWEVWLGGHTFLQYADMKISVV